MMRSSLRQAPVLTAALFAMLLCGHTDLLAQGKTKKAQNASAVDSPAKKGMVVLEVGREKFTAQQIADAYTKNANRGSKSFFQLHRDSAMEFVNLYANYRLKVQAAQDAGIDKRPEIIDELSSNRAQLAVPAAPATGYLLERRVVDPAVENIFKRRGEELKIAVIFTSMRIEDPADTLRAYRRTLDMFNQIKAGADFARMAIDSSNDPGTRASGGVIGYITSGMILRSLEDAAYETPAGKVYDGLIRVPSGFVLLKVLDRVPRIRVHAAHILFEADSNDPASKAQALAEAQQALQRLRMGGDFAALAREVSDDHVSGENGGDLMSFYTRSLGFEAKNGKLVPEFEDALFKLEPGQLSDVVQTGYGYHIIKVLDKQKPSFDEEKETIRQLYKQRYLSEDRTAFVRQVLVQQGFRVNEATLHELLAVVNQRATTADSAWATRIGANLRGRPLYSFHGSDVTVGNWMDSINTHPTLRATALSEQGITNSVVYLLEPIALAEASKNLEQEYPEFASLMHEFRDGILIFKLEEEMVWDKVNKGFDEDLGQAFFERHRDRYKTQPELAMTEIFVYNENEAKALLDKARSMVTPFDTLAALSTQRQGYRERAGKWPLSTSKNSDLVKQVLARKPDAKPGDILEPFPYQGGFSIIRVDSVEVVRPMSYEEARSEVQGDFMDERTKQLTKEWIDALRLKYRVKINERALESMLATN